MKRFDIKDGYGIVEAGNLGVDFMILTGRKSEIVKCRAEKF